MRMMKLLIVVAAFACCSGFTDARLTGVWMQTNMRWSHAEPGLLQRVVRFAYFTPSGKFISFWVLTLIDDKGAVEMDVQDGQEIFYGILKHSAPTRIESRVISVDSRYVLKSSDFRTDSVVANSDGSVTIGRDHYRRLTDKGDDKKLSESFDSLMSFDEGLKPQLNKGEKCPFGCRALW